MTHEGQPQVTPVQIEKASIGLWAAGGIMTVIVGLAFAFGTQLSRLETTVETIAENQAEGQTAAVVQRAEIEASIAAVERVTALRSEDHERRLRPVETEMAVLREMLRRMETTLQRVDERTEQYSRRLSPETPAPGPRQ